MMSVTSRMQPELDYMMSVDRAVIRRYGASLEDLQDAKVVMVDGFMIRTSECQHLPYLPPRTRAY